MKKWICVAVLTTALAAGGCGTAKTNQAPDNSSSAENDTKVLTTIEGRDIIAQLKQTVDDSPIRDLEAQKQLTSTEYTEGYFGTPSKELEEDLAVQAIEGPAAIEAVGKVYGEGNEFDKEGVLFFENQAAGGERSGIWIGLKNPDERVERFLEILQAKVDLGEILAEPIYIFRSPHTQHELYVQQDNVAKAINQRHDDRGSYSVSVNTITGIIEIGHDFLKDKEIEELEKQFPDFTLYFRQEGSMVAEPGQSAIIHPKESKTGTPVEEGGFVLETSENGFFVAGGTEGAVNYSFSEADQLSVGRRVKVEATGGIAESYPAQGNAKFVEVLPDYHPSGATLSESQVVKIAIEKKPNDFIVIDKISYDAKRKNWSLIFKDGSVLDIQDR